MRRDTPIPSRSRLGDSYFLVVAPVAAPRTIKAIWADVVDAQATAGRCTRTRSSSWRHSPHTSGVRGVAGTLIVKMMVGAGEIGPPATAFKQLFLKQPRRRQP
jgi:hypothetical protein